MRRVTTRSFFWNA